MKTKKRNKKTLINIYNINPKTSAYMIEVSLDDYAELFNGWDTSPLRRRDLEPEFLDFLEQCGSEVPIKNKIELYLYLPERLKDEEKEKRSKTGIINNFKVVLFLINKNLKKMYRQIVTNIILSSMFLIAAYFFKNVVMVDGIFSTIFVEGLYIGGWVLLWEAFSVFFFDSYETRQRRKIFLRFLNMKIHFKYLKD